MDVQLKSDAAAIGLHISVVNCIRKTFDIEIVCVAVPLVCDVNKGHQFWRSDCRGAVFSISTLYSGSPRLEFRDQLLWLWFFVGLPCLFQHIPGYYLKMGHNCFLSHAFQFIICIYFTYCYVIFAVKLSLCLIKHHAMKMCRNGGITPHILNFSTIWKWLVTFTLWSLYPLGKRTRYPSPMMMSSHKQASYTLHMQRSFTPDNCNITGAKVKGHVLMENTASHKNLC
jgi:hypothetical protein